MPNARRRKSEPVSTEPLEQRAMLTAMISGQALVVVGTAEPDTIVVSRSSGSFFVEENGVTTRLPTGGVTSLRVSGLAGGDTIDTSDIGLTTLITGGSGADSIRGGNGLNEIRGGGGDDTIFGGLIADIISGGGGDDFIRGRTGDDRLSGGNGADTIEGSSGTDVILGGNGDDSLRGDLGEDTVLGAGGDDIVEGSAGSDSLRGGGGNDIVSGEAGSDTVWGDAGADSLSGGDGNDLVLGGNGADEIMGGAGRDILVGGFNSDTLLAGTGDDILIAGTQSLGLSELNDVAAEWRSDNSYDQRVANLRNGSGRIGSRLNGDEFLIGSGRDDAATVFNDPGFADNLFGEQGEDWFFLATGFGDDDNNDRIGSERDEPIS